MSDNIQGKAEAWRQDGKWMVRVWLPAWVIADIQQGKVQVTDFAWYPNSHTGQEKNSILVVLAEPKK